MHHIYRILTAVVVFSSTQTATCMTGETKTRAYSQEKTQALFNALAWTKYSCRYDAKLIATIKQLAIDGADLAATNSRGTHALTLAISAHQDGQDAAPIIAALLEEGAPVNKPLQRRDLYTPLMIAIYPPFDGTNSGTVTEYAQAPLYPESDRAPGSLEIATMLLDRGADINAQDGRGRTALMHAVTSAQPEMVALLLARKADIYKENKDGKTVFDLKGKRHYRPLERGEVEQAIYQQHAAIDARIQAMLHEHAKTHPRPAPAAPKAEEKKQLVAPEATAPGVAAASAAAVDAVTAQQNPLQRLSPAKTIQFILFIAALTALSKRIASSLA